MVYDISKNVGRLVFALIGINFLLWNMVMPVFEPADESSHYAHVLFILKNEKLPNLLDPSPPEKGLGYTTYPPYYYFSLIPLAKLINAPLESEELLPYHPQKELFKKSVFAVYLHTKDELFLKWNNLIRAVHLMRLQTSFYGLLTVYLIYLTGKKVFGEESHKPLLAVILIGLNPMFAHISNSIVNVNLNILLFSVFFYLAVRSFVNFSNFSAVKFAKLNFVLGVITGVAYLSKITGLMLIPIWIVFTICHLYRFLVPSTSLRASKPGMTLKNILVFIIGFILSAGWYLARNFKLYGSLLETEAAIKHFGRPAMQLEMSGPINYWTGFIQTNFKTFFSGYGMVTVNLSDGILFLLLIILLIGIWGILIRIGKIRQVILYRFRLPPTFTVRLKELFVHGSRSAFWRTGKSGMTMELFLIASAILIILGHVAVNINVEAFHARDLFIGMAPFSLLLVEGVCVWLKELQSGKLWSNRIINFLMFSVFLAVNLFHFLQPVLVDFVKLVLTGFQILSPVTGKLAIFIAIFYIIWAILKFFSLKIAKVLIGISTNKNFLWSLSGGLFLSNILILLLLVIPKLYQL